MDAARSSKCADALCRSASCRSESNNRSLNGGQGSSCEERRCESGAADLHALGRGSERGAGVRESGCEQSRQCTEQVRPSINNKQAVNSARLQYANAFAREQAKRSDRQQQAQGGRPDHRRDWGAYSQQQHAALLSAASSPPLQWQAAASLRLSQRAESECSATTRDAAL